MASATYSWLGPDNVNFDSIRPNARIGLYLYKYQAPTPLNLQSFSDAKSYFSRIRQLDDPEEGIINAIRPEDVQPHFWEPLVGEMGIGIQLGTMLTDENRPRALELGKARWKEVTELLSSLGIYCLSEIPNSPRMWEIYGANHQGFCIGFAICDFQLPGSGPIPVPERIVYEPKGVQDIHFGHLCATTPSVEARAIKLLLTKHDKWAYQRERRIFSPASGAYRFPWPLAHVIFGAACSSSTRREIGHAAAHFSGGKLEFYEAQPNTSGIIRIVRVVET